MRGAVRTACGSSMLRWITPQGLNYHERNKEGEKEKEGKTCAKEKYSIGFFSKGFFVKEKF